MALKQIRRHLMQLSASLPLLTAGVAGPAFAQSAGGFAADPNAETNQIPAPSNLQPADPGAASYPSARQPTDPQKRGEFNTPGRFVPVPRIVPAPVPPGLIR